MATIKTFIKRHPVLSYFVLTFAVSWGGMLAVVRAGAGGFSITPEQLQALVPYAVPAMLYSSDQASRPPASARPSLCPVDPLLSAGNVN